jgi:hypothetical protein
MFHLRPLSPIVLCSLYGPLSSLWPSVSSIVVCPPLKPYVPYLALCPRPRYSVLPMALYPLYGALFNLYGPLSSLRLSTDLYPLYDPLFPQQPSVLSTALCLLFSPYPLCDPLSPLRPSVLSWPSVRSTALCLLYSSFPLYDHLSPLGPSVLSTALYLLYSPLSPLWPSVPSTALGPLCGPLSPLWPPVPSEKQRNKRNGPLLSRNVLQNVFRQNSKVYRNLFCISDNHDIAIITIITHAKYSAIITK